MKFEAQKIAELSACWHQTIRLNPERPENLLDLLQKSSGSRNLGCFGMSRSACASATFPVGKSGRRKADGEKEKDAHARLYENAIGENISDFCKRSIESFAVIHRDMACHVHRLHRETFTNCEAIQWTWQAMSLRGVANDSIGSESLCSNTLIGLQKTLSSFRGERCPRNDESA